MMKILIVMLLAAVIVCVHSKNVAIGNGEVCGPNSEFKSCGSACPVTCANRHNPPQMCIM
ncbi:unnamed protein product, partial [Didymodactylos carnosus]